MKSNENNKYILDLENIEVAAYQNKGQSQSRTIQKDGDRYQLKTAAHDSSSLLPKALYKRFFRDKDEDDISEFISTVIAKSLMQKEGSGPDLVPDVKLAIENNKIKLASKYLNYGSENFSGMTLDHLFHKKILAENLDNNTLKQNEYNSKELLKK